MFRNKPEYSKQIARQVTKQVGRQVGRQVAVLGLAGLLLAGAIGCGESAGGERSGSAATARCKDEKVRFQLSFFPNAQFAGFLSAAKRGFFKQEGLDVQIKPGGPTIDPATLLAQGTVDLALVNQFALVAQERRAPITFVGEVLRTTSMVLVAKKSAGIRTPADLRGRKIGIERAGAHPDLDAILRAGGLTGKDAQLVSLGFGIDGVLSGKVDAGTQQTFFHKAQWKSKGFDWTKDLTVFAPKDYGYAGFGQLIGVNDGYKRKNADAVTCFLRASRRGWEFSLDHPDQAISDVLPYLPQGVSSRADQVIDLAETNALVLPEGTPRTQLLRVDPNQVTATGRSLRDTGHLKKDVDLGKSVDASLLP